MSDTTHDTDAPLHFGNDVNCMNVKVVYDYLMRKTPEKAGDLFKNLPAKYTVLTDPVTILTDENNWVSSDLIVQIFKNIKEILNDPEAPYHIGFEFSDHPFHGRRVTYVTQDGMKYQVMKVASKFMVDFIERVFAVIHND